MALTQFLAVSVLVLFLYDGLCVYECMRVPVRHRPLYACTYECMRVRVKHRHLYEFTYVMSLL